MYASCAIPQHLSRAVRPPRKIRRFLFPAKSGALSASPAFRQVAGVQNIGKSRGNAFFRWNAGRAIFRSLPPGAAVRRPKK